MLERHFIVDTRPLALSENMIFWENCRITVLTDRLFRIERADGNGSGKPYSFCDCATQAVWYRDLSAVKFRTVRRENGIRVITDKVTLAVDRDPEKSAVCWKGRTIPLNNEGNLSGTYRTLDRCDGNLYVPVHGNAGRIQLGMGVVSQSGVAVMDDSSSLLLLEDGTLQKRSGNGTDHYVFAYGHEYREALKAFFRICGKTPQIPRFALGNWWSRYHAYTEKEYLHLMDSFAQRDVPFTVAAVDMDWHWSVTLDEARHITEDGKNDAAHGGNNGWTGYSWNTDLFPDYRRFLRKLHERGLRVTLNLHPALGVRYFEDSYRAMAEEMGIDPATEAPVAFDIADPKFINAYFKILHKPYEHDGVDFWWIDWQQGSTSSMEGLDPLWALNHYHFLDSGLEHAPLILSRYCGPGSHRYPLGFSGDTFVTWNTLRFLPYFTATAANIGYTWWSHDIGGHWTGEKDDELYVRSLQFGVFSPVMRLHSTAYEAFSKEPCYYMNGTGLIAEEFLRFRHRLIPYLYSASRETSENGRALIEPLYYEWPEQPEAYACRNQYLFGGQLMVAPVTEKSVADGMAVMKVWLPFGMWTDIFTGDEYQGGRTVTMARWLDSIPVFAKEGGILVLDGRKNTNSVENPDRLEVRVYAGEGNYTLHEDLERDRGETVFESRADKAGIQKLCFVRRADEKIPARDYRILFPNIPEGDVTVLADGVPCEADVDDNGCVSVELIGIAGDTKVEITVSYANREREKRRERIRRNLARMQMGNDRREELYRNLCGAEGGAYKKFLENSPLSLAGKIRMLEVR